MPLDELTRFMTEKLSEPPYRARQLYHWLHERRATSFAQMTSLSEVLRGRLATAATLPALALETEQASQDGSAKFLFKTSDGELIESVYLPTPTRKTLCVSTQVGCAMGCRFCATGALGFTRNLRASEIVAQVHLVNSVLVARGMRGPRPLSNLVFMGMGEPLHNLAEVRAALTILESPEGPNFSPRHITVSTSGLVPRIREFARTTRAKLAISLNASDDVTRSAVMPVNRKWPIAELIAAVREFPARFGRRITFEYVLLGGVNDTEEDVRRLIALLAGLSVKVNLIAYNENPKLGFREVTDEAAEAFRERLRVGGIAAFVRENRGRDIAAACGQLAAGQSP